MVPHEEEPEQDLPTWEKEPTTIDELMDKYLLETKVSGKTPGTTLFVVQSKARDGTVEDVHGDQDFKLFLVP